MEPTLVAADLHADPAAVGAIRRAVTDPAFVDAAGPIRRFVNLGDALGRGPAPKELLERIDDAFGDLEPVWVRGNHEEALVETGEVLAGGPLSARAHRVLLSDDGVSSRLRALPATRTVEDVLFVHGGPVDPARLGGDRLSRRTWQRIGDRVGPAPDGYRITPEMALQALEAEVGPGGLVVTGHEHRELLRVRDGASAAVPTTTQVRIPTPAGPVRGRRLERDGRSLLARVGLGARRDGRVRFGVVTDDAVLLLSAPASV